MQLNYNKLSTNIIKEVSKPTLFLPFMFKVFISMKLELLPEDSPALIELLRELVSLSSSLSKLLISMSSNVMSSNACSEIKP